MSFTPQDPPRLWPASSLAIRLGISPRWLIEQAMAGYLPGVPAGRTWLFDPDVVEHVLFQRAQLVARTPNLRETTRGLDPGEASAEEVESDS